ncbi:MAG TPA: PBP1A family penicillin-binding protein [Candidatus Saccharimonadales bacterium]
MVRQGTYTKRVSRVTRVKRSLKRRWRWFKQLSKTKKVLLIATPILAFLIITPLITYIYYYNDIGDQDRLMNSSNTGVALTDRNGQVIYSIGRAQHRDLVPLDQISKYAQQAVISSEDKDFYKHGGFSVTGTLRALFSDISSGGIAGGGSTLTQQLARTTLLTNQQTLLRKYQELTISIAIEQRYSKDQILDMYLNSSFWGGTDFGIQEAAKTYFNKAPKDLDLAESAMLIGVLPAPNAYSPITGNATYAKERQTYVLKRMVEDGYITAAQQQAALSETLAYVPAQQQEVGKAPHFTQMVLNELYKKYGEEQVLRSGYTVKTTLDLNLQQIVENNIAGHMQYIQRNGGSNAAAVAIDPASGEVRALVGSADWNNTDWGKVNMATTARQPGSSFKSIYYTEALSEGIITPATILHDVSTDFNGYKPLDADRKFRGDVTVRQAISQSLNIPSVEVLQKLGIDKAVAAANRMGITSVDPNKSYGLSLALGAAETPLINMTNAYAAFANQGNQFSTAVIKQINNKYNQTIFTTDEQSKQVVTPQAAFLISSILSDYNARAPIFGGSLTVPGRTAAVKTGTTDDDRDAWTIGYTPQLVVGVWVGNNNNQPMQNGGSGMAGPIWVKTMQQALQGVANTPFTVPDGVIQKPVCYGTGALASTSGTNTYNEYFLASALPTDTCNATQKQETQNTDTTKQPDTNTTKEPTTSTGNTDPNTNTGTGTSTGTGTGTNTGTGSGTGTGTGTGTGSGTGTGTGGGTTGTGGTGIIPVTP